MNLPNSITLMRLLAMPVLLLLAWRGLTQGFLWLLLACLISDVLDGFIARMLRQESELGARLDSWADFAIYITLPLGGWWLWPELIREQAAFIALVVASLGIPPLVGLIKFHRTTSYHTWSAKLAAMSVACSALLMFAGGPVWPFQLASPLAVLAALEEVAITCVLDRARSDIPSIWHLLKLRSSH